MAVDSAAELQAMVPPQRAHTLAAAIVTLLRRYRVTALLTKEIPKPFSADVDFTDLPISVLAENVLLLRQVPMGGQMHRVLGVLKMRFSEYDQHLHEFTITEQGLMVLGRWMGPLGIAPGSTGEQPPPTAATAVESETGPAG